MLDERGILGGVRISRMLPESGMGNVIIAAATECTTQDDIAAYAAALKEVV
jgi:glycine dehydrogenase subunit 1